MRPSPEPEGTGEAPARFCPFAVGVLDLVLLGFLDGFGSRCCGRAGVLDLLEELLEVPGLVWASFCTICNIEPSHAGAHKRPWVEGLDGHERAPALGA